MKIFLSALLLLSCAPGAAAQPAQSDERADALLKEVAAASRAIRTLTADLEVVWQTPGQPPKKNTGSVKLMKPNYGLIRLTGDYPLQTLASDGKNIFTMPDATRYMKAEADPAGAKLDSPWWGLPFRHFFTQSVNPFGAEPDATAKTHYAGQEELEGESFQVVEVSGEKPMAYTARFYIGADKLVRRTSVIFGQGERAASFRAKLVNVRTDRLLAAADFRFKPPATARLDRGEAEKMLPLGEKAPEFTLPTPQGGSLSLADIIRGKKATLVNFWYLDCPPCRKEFPIFQKLYTALKDKGFTIVAVNRGDAARPVQKYLKETGLTFPVVLGGESEPGVFGKYAVAVYPASYLLDAEGKIVYRSAGFDEAGLRQALEKLGLK